MTNHDPQPSSTSMPKGRAAEQAGGVTDEIKGAAGDMAREARNRDRNVVGHVG